MLKSLQPVLMAFALLSTRTLAIAGSLDFAGLDPNLQQFLSAPAETQAQHCTACVEAAITSSSKFGSMKNVQSAIQFVLHEQKQPASPIYSETVAAKDLGTHLVFYLDHFDPMIAQRLAEKVNSNSLSPGRMVMIVYGKKLVEQKNNIIRHLREVLQNHISLPDSAQSETKGGAKASFSVGDRIQIGQRKLRFKVLSIEEFDSHLSLHMGAQNGKSNATGSYLYTLDNQRQFEIATTLGGGEANSISFLFRGRFK